MKRTILILFSCLMLLCGCSAEKAEEKISIVATNFAAYDFARAVAGTDADVRMLLPPGTELHTFEPTAEDIIKIQNADLFVYTGGEGDSWVERVIATTELKTIKMLDCSSLLAANHEDEFDEHVWLSPENAKSITLKIAKALGEIDPENPEYLTRAQNYCAEITSLAAETKAVINAAKNKTIVVADRFPLRYLCHYYSLDFEAAFDACDLLSDADAKTVLRLINTVKQKNLSAVFYIENGSGYLADTVCEATDAERLILNSMHSVTADDFEAGVTYPDIMKQNKTALERGLN